LLPEALNFKLVVKDSEALVRQQFPQLRFLLPAIGARIVSFPPLRDAARAEHAGLAVVAVDWLLLSWDHLIADLATYEVLELGELFLVENARIEGQVFGWGEIRSQAEFLDFGFFLFLLKESLLLIGCGGRSLILFHDGLY